MMLIRPDSTRIFAGALLLLNLSLALAQQRPLQTDDPRTIPSGQARIQLGFEYYQNQTFTLSGLEGDLTRLGQLGLFFGAGSRVEFQVTGTLLNTLNVNRRFPAYNSPKLSFQGDSTSSIGDFTLATKFALLDEKGRVPALGFRFGVEMPNAGNEPGLGNDQTNFYSDLLIGKSSGRWRAIGNIGLAILGNPTLVSAQKDQWTYGGAVSYELNPRWIFLGELNGRRGPAGPGTDERAQFRLGTRIRTGNFRWDLAGVAGLYKSDPDTGVLFGASYEFRPFRK